MSCQQIIAALVAGQHSLMHAQCTPILTAFINTVMNADWLRHTEYFLHQGKFSNQVDNVLPFCQQNK